MRIQTALCLTAIMLLSSCSDNDDSHSSASNHGATRPDCGKLPHTRVSARFPEVMVSDWGTPVKLSSAINTYCPEDAIEISADGSSLYFMYTEDLLSLLGADMLELPNGTYVAERTGGPGDFSNPLFYDLGLGTRISLDGEPSFNSDASKVYFHSNRAANTGYAQGFDDFLDIYVADVRNGVPGVARNLGAPVNSVHADGEHTLHPDGVTLYFSSHRPGPGLFAGGPGMGNIWRSTLESGQWSEPEILDTTTINRPFSEQKQPTFSADGMTMYFVSDHFPEGAAIYRSTIDTDGNFSTPELVIRGLVGEPSLTADGRYLYFVHVLADSDGGFDSDIWYVESTE
jgi:Tol biopolymer transport system component